MSTENPAWLAIIAQRTFNLSDIKPERLTDLDVAGDGGLVIAGMTGVIKLKSEQAPNSTLTISSPTYDCQTGQLIVNTTGGNGGAIDYQIIGLRGWSSSNTFSVPDYQRQATTFKLEARQNGQVASSNFTTACTSTPSTGAFALRQPDYNCETGALTILYSNGDGSAVEYRVIGLRDWGPSPTFTVPSYQRQGTAFLLEARTSSGKTANLIFTMSCGTYNPPPPSPEGLSISDSFDCYTGLLVVKTTGGNGSPIAYKVPGLRDWATSSQFIVPIYQRNGTTFTLYAQQSGQEYTTQYTTACGFGGRETMPTSTPIWQAVVLPNPVSADHFWVEVKGASRQVIHLELTTLNGYILQTKEIEVDSSIHQEPILLPNNGSGIYLLRLSTQQQTITLRVLKY